MTRTTATATATTDARPKRRVAIFVEPSPFSHVSGMKNRFLRLIENLREMGDDVVVITPDRDPPKEYHGAKVIGLRGFVLPFYGTDTLLCSFGLDGRVWREFKENKPDLVHCAVPGGMIFGAMTYCKAMDIPLVESYHTHIPHYIPRYTWAGLVKPMWDLIRFWNGYASTTLVTSSILENELRGEGCKNLQVWDKGVDTVAFNPSFKSEEMRKRLSGGRDGPIIGCVGRLGAEKRLGDLKDILAKLPSNVNLAIIGDGPERKRLEEHFAGTNTVFTGMITGDDLSAAYASLDVFVMPSPSETLGFVVMESMASGVPVVAVAAGGLLDILTNPGDVGLLYPEYDYDKAAEHVKMLLENDSERQRMGAASRADVEKWGWMSSNRNLRENQYSKGLERFFKLRNLRKAIKAIGIRRRAVAVFDFLISGQHILQVAIFAAAVSALVYARQAGPIATATKVKAAFGATSWLNVAESAISKAGPVLAPLCLTAITTLAAIIPFVPTQPLFIMAGLFFGPTYGAALGLCAAVCAAAVSASASRARGYRQISDDLAQQTGARCARASIDRGAVEKGEPRRERRRRRPRASLQGFVDASPPARPVHGHQLPPRSHSSPHPRHRGRNRVRHGAVGRLLRHRRRRQPRPPRVRRLARERRLRRRRRRRRPRPVPVDVHRARSRRAVRDAPFAPSRRAGVPARALNRRNAPSSRRTSPRAASSCAPSPPRPSPRRPRPVASRARASARARRFARAPPTTPPTSPAPTASPPSTSTAPRPRRAPRARSPTSSPWPPSASSWTRCRGRGTARPWRRN